MAKTALDAIDRKILKYLIKINLMAKKICRIGIMGSILKVDGCLSAPGRSKFIICNKFHTF